MNEEMSFGKAVGIILVATGLGFLTGEVITRLSAGGHGSKCYPNGTCDPGLYCLKEEGIGTHCIKTKVP